MTDKSSSGHQIVWYHDVKWRHQATPAGGAQVNRLVDGSIELHLSNGRRVNLRLSSPEALQDLIRKLENCY